uniref:Uncharacterized protein n=1 Tax=Cebus imitator TaxID=2715852 RepID=A0A2K5S3N8_CEBIM
MKLLTHHLLSSHVWGATEVRFCPMEFNPQFVAPMIPKVEWAAFLKVADNLHLIQVPKGPVEGYEENKEFLRTMYHLLLEVRSGPSLLPTALPHSIFY